MTAQQKQKVTIWAVLGGIAAAATIASAALAGGRGVARAAAVEQVAPVEHRVTKLETQREEDVKRLDEIKADVKELLRRSHR